MIWALLAFAFGHLVLTGLFVAWARTRSNWIAVPALVLDAFYNFTTAWALWGKPRRGEWTISKRLKRPQTRNQVLAKRLAAWLNKHDPGHV